MCVQRRKGGAEIPHPLSLGDEGNLLVLVDRVQRQLATDGDNENDKREDSNWRL